MIVRHDTRTRSALVSKIIFFSHKVSLYIHADHYVKKWKGKKISDYIKRK